MVIDNKLNGNDSGWRWAIVNVFTVICFVGVFLYQFAGDVKTDVLGHENLPGHPIMMERYGGIQEQIKRLDQKIDLSVKRLEDLLGKESDHRKEISSPYNNSSPINNFFQEWLLKEHSSTK